MNGQVTKYDKDIRNAIEVMRRGGVILYPTDTVWGLGCDATRSDAVERIFAIKQRADSKALICLVDSANRLQRYVRNIPDVAWDIIELATKPVTVILDGAANLAPNVMAEDGSAAFRVTREEFSHELCYRFQKPVVSTSVNISGMPAAATFGDISEEMLGMVDYVCLSRRREKARRAPSSVIKLSLSGEVNIIRK